MLLVIALLTGFRRSYNERGFSLEEIKKLFQQKEGNKLVAGSMQPFSVVNEKIWTVGAEIFIPGAASKLVTKPQVESLIENDLEVVACGANVPFIDDGVFFGETAKFTDSAVSLIPDFIANCGMARVFAYLMQPDVRLTDDTIFGDVSETIYAAIMDIFVKNKKLTGISTRALEISLKKLKES